MPYLEEPHFRDGVAMPFHCAECKKSPKSQVLPPNTLHFHNSCEIVLCKKGIVNCYLSDKLYQLNDNELLFINANEPHQIKCDSDNGVYFFVRFPLEVLISGNPTYHEFLYTLFFKNPNNSHMHFDSSEIENSPMISLFSRLVEEYYGMRYGYELCARACIFDIFANLVRICQARNEDILRKDLKINHAKKLEEAIKLIEKNFTETNESLIAEQMNITTSHLSRLFKNGLNLSFSSFLNSLKLRESEKLLLTTNKSITEIGNVCGFSTTAYFILKFRLKHNITPQKYRKAKTKQMMS